MAGTGIQGTVDFNDYQLRSAYKSFDIARNILYTILFIVNNNECLSAEFVGQTSVPYRKITANIHGGPKKWDHRLMTIILSNRNRFQKILTGRFVGKFVAK